MENCKCLSWVRFAVEEDMHHPNCKNHPLNKKIEDLEAQLAKAEKFVLWCSGLVGVSILRDKAKQYFKDKQGEE